MADQPSKQESNIFLKMLWPGNAKGEIGVLWAAFTLALLLRHGVGYEHSQILEQIFAKYELAMSWALDWAKEDIEALLTSLGWHLTLQWQWKHIFSLMGLYFARDVQNAWTKGAKRSAVFHAVLGFTVALGASILSGRVPASPGDFWSAFAIATIPITGLLVYSLIGRAWGAMYERNSRYDARLEGGENLSFGVAFYPRAFRALARTAVAVGIIWFCLQAPQIVSLNSAGIVLFAGSIFFLGVYWMVEAVVDVPYSRQPGESWLAAYSRGNSAIVGAGIVSVFVRLTLIVADAVASQMIVPH